MTTYDFSLVLEIHIIVLLLDVPQHILYSLSTPSQGSVDHCVVGVQILHTLVVEMNQVEGMRSLTNHRKVASSFKDESLYDIFTLSCTLLRQINVHDKTQVSTYKISLFLESGWQ